MASTVEIIIKAVDKYSKDMKKAESRLDKFKAKVELAGKVTEAFAKVGAAVAAGFALAYNVLDKFGDRAKDLGFAEAAKQVDFMKQSLADAEASIYKFNIAGREIQEWLGRAADAFGWLIRLVGVLVTTGFGELQKGINTVHASFSELSTIMSLISIDMAEWLGQMSKEEAQAARIAEITNTYTSAMKDADNALVDLAVQTNVANFATVGLAASLESAATNAQKQAQSIKALAKNHKNLNQILSQRRAIEDAIRAGDARALADARGGNGSGAREQGGPGGGRNMSVNVYIGNEKLKGQIRTTVSNDLMKPTTKGGGSGGKK